MAIGDISAIAPIMATPGTAVTQIGLVPAGEEWTIRFARAVCLVGSGIPPTISLGLSTSANELCFNEVVPIPTASVQGAKNILGPDFITLPPGATIYARSSTASAVRLLLTGTKKALT